MSEHTLPVLSASSSSSSSPSGWERIVAIVDAAPPIALIAPSDIASAFAAPPAPAAASPAAESASSQTRGSARIGAKRGAGRAATEQRNARAGSIGRFERRDHKALDGELASYPMTDLGNAERFRERNRGRLIFCPAIGWFCWDQRRWAHEGADEQVMIAAHLTARSIQDEAEAIAGTDRDFVVETKNGEPVMYSQKLAAWGRASESAGRLARIGEQARAYLAVRPAELDADPYRINVLNGTVKIDRAIADGYVALQPHDPADLITKLAPVVYDAAATCPLFDAFIAEVQPDAACQRFLAAWHGYSLTGDVREQKLVMHYGKGKNGKSVFVDAIAHVAGDYAKTVPIETFLDQGRGRNAGQATPDLAILPGVRMLRTSEPEKGAKLAEALIKLATGGEPMLVRNLNRDYFEFYPVFKLTISGNYRPQIAGADDGIWRRMMLVPWLYTVPEHKRDLDLTRKLHGEAAGILNWLIDGVRDYFDHGLTPPEQVVEATAEYRKDSDPVGQFLAACVEMVPDERVQSSEMHNLFTAWARANGAAEWSNKGLSNALAERGLRKLRSSVIWWLDVRLIKTPADFVDADGKPLRLAYERGPEIRKDAADGEIAF